LCATISQPRASAASSIARRRSAVTALIVHDGRTPAASKVANIRNAPTRWPYSRHV
jgi:hypothetical protein